MNEDQSEIGPAETQERRAFRKACAAYLKTAGSKLGWRSKQGKLFRQSGIWFVDVSAGIWLGKRKTTFEFTVKPMALVPLFWDICEIPQNRTQPLSFRSSGSWTCQPDPWAEFEISEQGLTPEKFAEQVLDLASLEMARMQSISTEEFVDFVLTSRRFVRKAVPITALCLVGRFAEARALSLEGLGRNDGGGFGMLGTDGRVNFYDWALRWLDKQVVH